MRVLGISCHYHDSAAALIDDGVVVAAVEEERLSRAKHDNAFPAHAIRAVLDEARIRPEHVDAIAFYERPLRKFERILDSFVLSYPRSFPSFARSMPDWFSEKLRVEHLIRARTDFSGPVLFVPHHRSHAAFAFYSSPFPSAAVLTADGVGEWETTAISRASGSGIEQLVSLEFPHSLGLLYSTMTAFLGFPVNDGEGKVMALAAYGKPRHLDRLTRVADVRDDGSLALDMRYFDFRGSERMWSDAFLELFGGPRAPGGPLTDRERDLAASMQAFMEDAYFKMLAHAHRVTGERAVCISGGVALNAAANGKVLARTPFSRIHVPGPAGDSGAACGAALAAYHELAASREHAPLPHLSLGTAYADADIFEAIAGAGVTHETFADTDALAARAADMLARGEVLGWFEGRMEFGPRALGNRSILADPRIAAMRERLNACKNRDAHQPFACAILEERAGEYFDLLDEPRAYRHMTLCANAREKAHAELPAVLHVDGTSRLQTVGRENGAFHAMLTQFEEKTGVPALLNTSFNRKGEPVVESPAQALADLAAMPLDALCIGRFLIEKRRRE